MKDRSRANQTLCVKIARELSYIPRFPEPETTFPYNHSAESGAIVSGPRAKLAVIEMVVWIYELVHLS